MSAEGSASSCRDPLEQEGVAGEHQTAQGAAGDVSEIFQLYSEHPEHTDEGLSAAQQSGSTAPAPTYSKFPQAFQLPLTTQKQRHMLTLLCRDSSNPEFLGMLRASHAAAAVRGTKAERGDISCALQVTSTCAQLLAPRPCFPTALVDLALWLPDPLLSVLQSVLSPPPHLWLFPFLLSLLLLLSLSARALLPAFICKSV